jgi:hypothetical protein
MARQEGPSEGTRSASHGIEPAPPLGLRACESSGSVRRMADTVYVELYAETSRVVGDAIDDLVDRLTLAQSWPTSRPARGDSAFALVSFVVPTGFEPVSPP